MDWNFVCLLSAPDQQVQPISNLIKPVESILEYVQLIRTLSMALVPAPPPPYKKR